jgi:hypothetical protein
MRKSFDDTPFKGGYHADKGLHFELGQLVQSFAQVQVLPTYQTVHIEDSLLQSYAVELATEVYDSNTAEKLVYIIQQLLFNERDQRHSDSIGCSSKVNPKNTTFQDLEPWAVMDSNGTVTVDTDKLAKASYYVDIHVCSSYTWVTMLVELNGHYFKFGKQHRIDEILCCTEESGLNILLCYLDSSRLTQLAQLPSIWDYDKHDVLPLPGWFIKDNEVDCAAMIENNTLIVEAAVASLTVRYSEAVRQQLIARLLVMRWIGAAVLNKGVLPATSMQVLGHIVVDFRPLGRPWKSVPSLTSDMAPDYEDIPITVHNCKLEFVKYDKRFHG